MGGRTKGWACRRTPAPSPHGLAPCSPGPAHLFCALVTNDRPTPPPRSVPASLGLPLSCWPQAPAVLGPAPSDRPRVARTPGPSPSRLHTHTPGPEPPAAWAHLGRRQEEADGRGLSGQAARPSESGVWAAAAGKAGRAGRRPACGFRLHGGTFPRGPSWEGCARGRVGSIPVIFLSTWHCDQAALLAGAGPGLREGKGYWRPALGSLSGGLGPQPQAAWEGRPVPAA